MIRSKRIVQDMLRRGYALLVEVERGEERAFERVLEFREDTCEYIIADFDQDFAREEDDKGKPTRTLAEVSSTKRKTGGKRRTLDATRTSAVAVGRSAGG